MKVNKQHTNKSYVTVSPTVAPLVLPLCARSLTASPPSHLSFLTMSLVVFPPSIPVALVSFVSSPAFLSHGPDRRPAMTRSLRHSASLPRPRVDDNDRVKDRPLRVGEDQAGDPWGYRRGGANDISLASGGLQKRFHVQPSCSSAALHSCVLLHEAVRPQRCCGLFISRGVRTVLHTVGRRLYVTCRHLFLRSNHN